ncbi:MAG TPA: tRNA 2-thiouridine(34) synthase MnmA [Thermoanaerobaculia bacterium]|nr:tRNA 2-thiouridine(34) synthase MnmA [Thermoanaerobaculia bacterium]
MKIAVAMSGGVDSSTAAYILKSQGHEVIGMSMQMYNALDRAETEYGGCCTIDDLADARRVAWKLEIPHFILNMEAGFHEAVIKPFVQSYLSGSTPSPCVLCNTHVKFALMHDKALGVGAEKVATGHYARVTRDVDGSYELCKARDLAKDQSYFLFELNQHQLSQTIFPLGELTKTEVRAIASEGGLDVADKSESYEICFVPNADSYTKIVADEARKMASVAGAGTLVSAVASGEAGGDIVDRNGTVLGHHDAYYRFTIGQRRGLQAGGFGERMYVIDVDPLKRQVVVGPEEALTRHELIAERVHWISGRAPAGKIEVTGKIRSRSPEVAAEVEMLDDAMAKVTFRAPMRAVAPGQAVVFYQDDVCLGGGWITRG